MVRLAHEPAGPVPTLAAHCMKLLLFIAIFWNIFLPRSIGAVVFMQRKNLKVCLRSMDGNTDTSEIAKVFSIEIVFLFLSTFEFQSFWMLEMKPCN